MTMDVTDRTAGARFWLQSIVALLSGPGPGATGISAGEGARG